MAMAPVRSASRSSRLTIGTVSAGRPWGSRPTTETPARLPRSSTVTIRVASITAASTTGTRRQRLRTMITSSVPTPSARLTQLARPPSTPSPISRSLCSRPVAPMENPKSLGSWLTSTVSAMPFIYP